MNKKIGRGRPSPYESDEERLIHRYMKLLIWRSKNKEKCRKYIRKALKKNHAKYAANLRKRQKTRVGEGIYKKWFNTGESLILIKSERELRAIGKRYGVIKQTNREYTKKWMAANRALKKKTGRT